MFTNTWPDTTSRIMRCAVPTFVVHTPAIRPYSVPLARAIASSMSLKLVTASTGPKTSSWKIRLAASASSMRVGWKK